MDETIHNELRERFGEGTQKWAIVRSALAAVESALESLRTHGVHLKVEPGVDPRPHLEWPKVYTNEKGEILVVSSETMAKNLTPGWKPNIPAEVESAPIERVSGTDVFTLGMDELGRPRVEGAESAQSGPAGGKDVPAAETQKSPSLTEPLASWTPGSPLDPPEAPYTPAQLEALQASNIEVKST